LLEWIRPLARSIRKVFLVHGEPQQATVLAKLLKSQYNLETVVPAPGQGFELSS
jgi:metallo-beta-lactamase family protein